MRTTVSSLVLLGKWFAAQRTTHLLVLVSMTLGLLPLGMGFALRQGIGMQQRLLRVRNGGTWPALRISTEPPRSPLTWADVDAVRTAVPAAAIMPIRRAACFDLRAPAETVWLIGTDLSAARMAGQLLVTGGEPPPTPAGPGDPPVWVQPEYAQRHQRTVGDVLTLRLGGRTRSFRIAGLAYVSPRLCNPPPLHGTAICDLHDLGEAGGPDEIQVWFRADTEDPHAESAIRRQYAGRAQVERIDGSARLETRVSGDLADALNAGLSLAALVAAIWLLRALTRADAAQDRQFVRTLSVHGASPAWIGTIWYGRAAAFLLVGIVATTWGSPWLAGLALAIMDRARPLIVPWLSPAETACVLLAVVATAWLGLRSYWLRPATSGEARGHPVGAGISWLALALLGYIVYRYASGARLLGAADTLISAAAIPATLLAAAWAGSNAPALIARLLAVCGPRRTPQLSQTFVRAVHPSAMGVHILFVVFVSFASALPVVLHMVVQRWQESVAGEVALIGTAPEHLAALREVVVTPPEFQELSAVPSRAVSLVGDGEGVRVFGIPPRLLGTLARTDSADAPSAAAGPDQATCSIASALALQRSLRCGDRMTLATARGQVVLAVTRIVPLPLANAVFVDESTFVQVGAPDLVFLAGRASTRAGVERVRQRAFAWAANHDVHALVIPLGATTAEAEAVVRNVIMLCVPIGLLYSGGALACSVVLAARNAANLADVVASLRLHGCPTGLAWRSAWLGWAGLGGAAVLLGWLLPGAIIALLVGKLMQRALAFEAHGLGSALLGATLVPSLVSCTVGWLLPWWLYLVRTLPRVVGTAK